MTVLYNDIDPFACAWMRNLIEAGELPFGLVSDADIRTLEYVPETFHAFAGVGGWGYALRLAGWSEDVPVWTGSCPCQPFSTAGRRKGTDDERHLWPDWFKLIRAHEPAVVFGEQVASPDGLDWLDVVCADLEDAGYEVGAADLAAAGVGAPHKRQRLYFVAIAHGERREGLRLHLRAGRSRQAESEARRSGEALGMANADGGRFGSDERDVRPWQPDTPRSSEAVGMGDSDGLRSARDTDAGWQALGGPQHASEAVGLADAAGTRRRRTERAAGTQPSAEVAGESRRPSSADAGLVGDASGPGGGWDAGAVLGAQEEGEREGSLPRRLSHESVAAGAVRGFWSPAEWVACYDPRADGVVYRPVEPGLEPVASGLPARVGRLRGYGNALCAPLAATFVRSVMEVLCGD